MTALPQDGPQLSMQKWEAAIKPWPVLVVAAATSFNFFLCLLNTRGIHIGNVQIAACELFLIGTAALLARDAITRQAVLCAGIIGGYILLLKLVNDGLDLKIARDLLIPFVFYALGSCARSDEEGDLTICLLTALVLAVGLYEFLAVDSFQHYLNIADYYVAKGVGDQQHVGFEGTNLVASGMRPGGLESRTLFPALGAHRISSIFLEPVSAANFGLIGCIWFIGRLKARPLLSMAVIGLSLVIIVLADGRFAVGTAVIIAAVYCVPQIARRRLIVFLLPVAVLGALFLVYALSSHAYDGSTLHGRLVLSASILLSWGPFQWFGLEPSPRYTSDTGYAYMFANFGILPAFILWSIFAFQPEKSKAAGRLRVSIAICCALSLGISESMFTIKTAALLWYIYGVASRKRADEHFESRNFPNPGIS